MDESRPRDRSAQFLRAAAGALLAICLAFYLYPYTGIRHDSIFYLGQALSVGLPGEFSKDLFFLYGSQAQFTVFPSVIGWLMTRVEPGALFMWLTFAARLFFISAAWFFCRALLPRGFRYIALLSIVCLPAGYGGFGMLRYGEPFLTARPFAEAMVLLGLASLVNGRIALCACALLLGAVFHPLQAAGGIAVAYVWLCMHDRRWFRAAWLALPAVVAIGLLPTLSQRVLLRFDAAWFAPVLDLNALVFPTQWNFRDWAYWATDLYLLACLYRARVPKLSSLGAAASICMAAGMAASLVLGDALHFALPSGLQLWRAQWLAHLVAMAALPLLLVHQWRSVGRVPALVLAATALAGAPTGFGTFPWAVLLLIPLHASWPRLRGHVTAPTEKLVSAAMIAAMVIHLVRFAQTQLAIFEKFDHRTDLFRVDVILLAHPMAIGCLVAAAIWQWRRARVIGRIVCCCVGAALLAWVLSRWDFRSEWSRYVETAPLDASLFGPRIEPGAQVYWSGQLLPTWLTLGRASYYNPGQQAGQLFNRETALEATRRQARMAPLELQSSICAMMDQVRGNATACFVNPFALRHACTAAGDTSPPEYLVLPFRQPEKAIGEWVIPDSVRSEASAHYYLYRCRDLLTQTASYVEPST